MILRSFIANHNSDRIAEVAPSASFISERLRLYPLLYPFCCRIANDRVLIKTASTVGIKGGGGGGGGNKATGEKEVLTTVAYILCKNVYDHIFSGNGRTLEKTFH